MTDLPQLALSVRQPWAWAIIHAGKDIENRSWKRQYALTRAALDFRGPVCIHASKGMTQDEYADALETFQMAGAPPIAAAELLRGGIIGTVEIVNVVTESFSPWFCGPKGLVLRNPNPVDFIPVRGELGYFKWRRDENATPVPPAKWMLPRKVTIPRQEPLF
ncbi:MAG: hypothetical protein JWR80_7962 [Bradyrhizobium sp.]|nr:hypothetical protein [Bradyrhizobium sp.]